jgi:hypothetical protein
MSALVHLVDAVIVLTLLEVLVLFVIHRRSGAGVAPREIVLNLLSGLSLMVALRAALAQWGAVFILSALLIAGILHSIDLHRRWRR